MQSFEKVGPGYDFRGKCEKIKKRQFRLESIEEIKSAILNSYVNDIFETTFAKKKWERAIDLTSRANEKNKG